MTLNTLLPEDARMNVFSYFDHHDFAQAEAVCTYWKSLSNTPSALKSRYQNPKISDRQQIEYLAKIWGNLKTNDPNYIHNILGALYFVKQAFSLDATLAKPDALAEATLFGELKQWVDGELDTAFQKFTEEQLSDYRERISALLAVYQKSTDTNNMRIYEKALVEVSQLSDDFLLLKNWLHYNIHSMLHLCKERAQIAHICLRPILHFIQTGEPGQSLNKVLFDCDTQKQAIFEQLFADKVHQDPALPQLLILGSIVEQQEQAISIFNHFNITLLGHLGYQKSTYNHHVDYFACVLGSLMERADEFEEDEDRRNNPGWLDMQKAHREAKVETWKNNCTDYSLLALNADVLIKIYSLKLQYQVGTIAELTDALVEDDATVLCASDNTLITQTVNRIIASAPIEELDIKGLSLK